jgi:hypothetical protein
MEIFPGESGWIVVHNGSCPQCGGEVPHLRAYCSSNCGKKFRRRRRNIGLTTNNFNTGKRRLEKVYRMNNEQTIKETNANLSGVRRTGSR